MIEQPHSGHLRIPYTQRCQVWRTSGEAAAAVTCNVSDLGVYLTMDEIPDLGERLELFFPLPGGGQPVQAEGVVAWQNLDEPQRLTSVPPGCGVRFTSLSPADDERLKALVREYSDRIPPGIGASVPESGAVRVPCIQRCRIAVDGADRWGVVCNLSVLGVYVTLEEPLLPLNEHVDLSFQLPGEARALRSRCTVMWLNTGDPIKMDSLAPGCGLQFDLLSSDDRSRLERIVADHGRPIAGPLP
jgi:uncharacterized protein (TIGR02266 family)